MASSDINPPPTGFLPPWVSARLNEYFGRSAFIKSAGYHYLQSLWAALRRGNLTTLLPATAAHNQHRDEAFAGWYHDNRNGFITYESTTAVPGLVASARGVVLELGPGAGNQVHRFDATRVEHVYGVEPNAAFAGPLAERLREAPVGVDAKYTLVPCGIEDGDVLRRFGLGLGSVDCVVSMQVMCSLPDLGGQVRRMHALLRPGGELIFWEHCRSDDPITRAVQWLYCLVWPSVIGGCRLDRVTRNALVKAADWEVVDIQTDAEAHMLMPRIWGRLVKPRAS